MDKEEANKLFTDYVNSFKEIIYSDEFKQQQNDFLLEHNEFFDDSPENKFEYTAIFEEYQRLIEAMLFEKISQKHPDFDVEIFMTHLDQEDDSGALKETHLTDILLSFTDFQAFKTLMLESKNKSLFIGGEHSKSDEIFNLDNLIKLAENQDQWTVVNSDKKKSQYQYKHKTTDFLYKINYSVDDIPFQKFFQHMYDIKAREKLLKEGDGKNPPPKKFELIYSYDPKNDPKEKDVLNYGGDGYIICYNAMEMPFVSNRDFLMMYRFYKPISETEIYYIMRCLDLNNPADTQILTKLGKNPEDYKIKEGEKTIRAIYNRFYWVKKHEDRVEVNGVVKVDMSFFIPKFVWNWLLGKGFNVMLKTQIENLRKL